MKQEIKYSECPHCKKIAYKPSKECDYCGHYELTTIVEKDDK